VRTLFKQLFLIFHNSSNCPRSRYPSTVETSATVILSAHYDSRGSFGSTKAPGGDDDGSGVVALMGIARAIFHKGLTFRSNVELVAFTGEEQVRLI
jgi:Zn-dependent M28 family amino/carboxypeptidase